MMLSLSTHTFFTNASIYAGYWWWFSVTKGEDRVL